MFLKLPIPVRNLLKATRLWQENRLILQEFKHFRKITLAAVVFSLVAALMAGSTVALIGVFLQGLTNPTEPPVQTGIDWLDVWVLGTQASSSERIFRLSALILVVIWLQSCFIYLGQLYSRLAAINLADRLRKSLF